jgi:Penicillinase repressor
MDNKVLSFVNTLIALTNQSTIFLFYFTTSHQQELYSKHLRDVPLQKRVRVEFQDNDGTKYTLAVQGALSRDKVMKVMDLMELVEAPSVSNTRSIDNSTSFGRVTQLIESGYPAKEFSSADIARDYEESHGEHIALSTVSTYLSRLTDRGHLKRQKFGNSWVYSRVYLPESQLPPR